MDFDFDFRLHADRSSLEGTQYVEFLPGEDLKPWSPGSRYVHEYTFCLFEGIFEKGIPEYDHFGSVVIAKPQWLPILCDITNLASELQTAGAHKISLPYGATLAIQDVFERDLIKNQRALAALVSDLCTWIRDTLTATNCIGVLGL